MKKRILSFLLALLMVVSAFPVQAFATEEDPAETPENVPVEEITIEPCATCGQENCTSTHLTWCDVCKMDDCGVDHSAAEEPAVLAETDTEPQSPYLNKKANFNAMYINGGSFPISADPSNETSWSQATQLSGSEVPADLVVWIRAVKIVGSECWCLVEADEGHTLPEALSEKSWVFQNFVGDSEDSNSLVIIPPCDICGEYDCTGDHVLCDICGKYDCNAVHFWCEICQSYDCGKLHITCPACGEVDCTDTHVYCLRCGMFDCGVDHDAQFRPVTAPVLPENPTLPEGEAVAILDAQGEAVTTLSLAEGTKTSISAWPAGSEEAAYQWQVCYNNANDLWANIYGADEKGLLVSPAMFIHLIDYYGQTAVRCVATLGDETLVSDPIPVTVEEAVPVEAVAFFAAPRLNSTPQQQDLQTAAEEIRYSITVLFKYDAPNPDLSWEQAVTSYLAEGQDYVLDVPCPVVPGYVPENGQTRVTQTIDDIHQNITITVNYVPDFVDFRVEHYWQRVDGDEYDLHETVTYTDKKTGDPVGTNLQKTYEGFDDMIYDTEAAVAADGSTVVKIYYDRNYYIVALNLNGGFGAEPMVARYGTPIVIPDPQRTGYAFTGWKNNDTGLIGLDATVPSAHTGYTAQWVKADTNFTVAFWYENANDNGYTFVGSDRKTGTTGTQVSGSLADYTAATFDGKDSTNFKRLNAEKTDQNVTIKADGTTVVNVYLYRETYTLTYYRWQCLHTHSNACCTLQHTSHSDSCCSIPYHVNHTTGCVTNDLKKGTTFIPESDLDKAVPNRYNGVSIAYKYWGATRYYVWFDGSWYRTANGHDGKDPLNWDCCRAGRGQYTHDHTSGCTCTKYHDHSSGKLANCNTSGCTHTASYKCESDPENRDHWVIVYQNDLKYEADTSQIHLDMLGLADGTPGLAAGEYGLRWVPYKDGGFSHWNGDNMGNGTAVGAFTSMTSGNATFYEGGWSGNDYEIQYWLEGADGTGTKAYTKSGTATHYFNQGALFKNHMGNVAWVDEFFNGTPLGFEQYEATYGATKGADTFVLAQNGNQSAYKYNNFYYVRKIFKLEYRNGETSVTTRDMRYQQPMTSEFDLDGNSLGMKSPYGDGYVFGGWYMDPDGTIPAEFDGSTIMPNAGDSGTIGLALYAKWVPVTHTVTTYQTKGGNKLGDYTARHGETVAAPPANPERDGGYEFDGWFYEEDGQEKAYDFSVPVYKDLQLYAKWTSDTMIVGYIYYVDNAGNTLADPVEVRGVLGNTRTFNAKIGAALNKVTDGAVYFPNVTSHSITFHEQGSPQNNFTFYYTPREEVAYRIHFVDKDTGDEVHSTISGISKSASITFDLLENGIAISKYTADAMRKTFVLSADDDLNDFYFYFTYDEENATLQVEHYIENLAGTGYTLYFTEPVTTAQIGSTVRADYLSINGFTEDPGAAGTVNNVTMPETGIVLKLYYSRNSYPYLFRFVHMEAGQEVEFAGSAVSGTAKYGATVYQNAEDFPGYELISSGSMSITVGVEDPASNVNLRTFRYQEEEITIRYQVGAGGGGSVAPTSESLLAVNGTATGSDATVQPGGDYTFAGWYSNYAGNGTPLTTNTHFTPSNTGGVYEETTYYAKFNETLVDIRYVIDGPDGVATLSRASEQVSILTGNAQGSVVTVTDDRYTFDGWYDSTGKKVGTITTITPVRGGEKWVDETTYTAKIVEKKATVNYVAVGRGSVNPASEQVNMVTGIASGAAAAVQDHVSTFVGWYDNADCTGTELSTDADFVPATPAGGWAETQTYYAKFADISYTVTFEDRGNTVGTQQYVVGDTLTLPDVTNGDYIVTWTVKDTTGNWTNDAVDDGKTISCYGDVTLVANWSIRAIWVDYDFNPLNATPEDILYQQENIPFGTDPVYNGDVTTAELAARRNTPQYSYTFKEWAEEDLSAYGNPEGTLVYRATYDQTVNKYTVTWQDENGNTIDTEKVEYGVIPTHADPTKEATAEYTYTFTGWTPEVVAVTQDATYKATFAQTKRSYTITWLNEDGSTIDTTTVEYGVIPTHVDPAKAATAEYTYTFAGWTPDVVAVTGDATYQASFTATRNKYTVIWKHEDGTVLETDTDVEYGVMPTYNGETPIKPSTAQYDYTFDGWSSAVETVKGNVTYTATFAPVERYYPVTWVNEDGTVLEEDEAVKYGEMPSYDGETPVKAGNAQYSYTFAGWTPTVATVSGAATYTATYTQSINDYTVTWVNYDSTLLEKDENVCYGTMPSYDGNTPERAATAQYTYTFDGWDKIIAEVTGDVTYTAKFKETVNKYTVTFVDEDGTTILKAATQYDYGTKAAAIVKPADPTKEKTAEYTYTFAGWDPEIADVTENVTYKATYSSTVRKYLLSGVIDHGTVSDPVLVEYGTTNGQLSFKADPGYYMVSHHNSHTGEIYNFNPNAYGQTSFNYNPWVRGETVITMTTAPIPYTITYDSNGGSAVEPTSYNIEQAVTLASAPTREGYKFDGWKLQTAGGNWIAGDYTAGQIIGPGKYGNITLEAQWNDQYRYKLEYNPNTIGKVDGMPENVDTGWIDDNKYTADLSAKPTRAGYDFLGWATSDTATAADVLPSFELEGIANGTASAKLYAVWQRHTGDLKLTFNGGQTNPAIVTVTGGGKTIILVLTKSETVIKDLPTGTYEVTVESGNASYTASVKANPSPVIEKDQTAVVEIEVYSKGLNWFTAFYWVKNKFGKQN